MMTNEHHDNEEQQLLLESLFKKAAEAIYHTKFLIVATGAGFSACSGLPVYNDVANMPLYKRLGLSYHDLARPTMVEPDSSETDVSLFFGFWIHCMKQYKKTQPHDGYSILQEWDRQILSKKLPDRLGDTLYHTFQQRQLEFNQQEVEEDNGNHHRHSIHQSQQRSSSVPMAQSTFIYTSNVDAHFTKYFESGQLYEIHGNVFHWQCSNLDCANEHGIWKFPDHVLDQIEVDEQSMTLKSSFNADQVLKCKYCSNWNRPNVLLFGDFKWKRHALEENTYVSWECSAEGCIKSSHDDGTTAPTTISAYDMVVLEMGCGQKVPEVRLECENVVRDTLGKSLLIRINASKSDAQYVEDEQNLRPYTLSITSTSLYALQRIDYYLKEIHNRIVV